jgi:hypothetical protein
MYAKFVNVTLVCTCLLAEADAGCVAAIVESAFAASIRTMMSELKQNIDEEGIYACVFVFSHSIAACLSAWSSSFSCPDVLP